MVSNLFAKCFQFGEKTIDLGDTFFFVKGGGLDPAVTLDQIRWANRFRRDANCEMIRFGIDEHRIDRERYWALQRLKEN